MARKKPDFEMVHDDNRYTTIDIGALAAAQGVKPLTSEDLDAMSDVWPEGESVDDFIAAVRQWRSEDSEREMP